MKKKPGVHNQRFLIMKTKGGEPEVSNHETYRKLRGGTSGFFHRASTEKPEVPPLRRIWNQTPPP